MPTKEKENHTDLDTLTQLEPLIQVIVTMEWPELTPENTLALMEKKLATGMTLKELKERSGLHPNTIGNLRTGKPVGPDSQIKILNALGYKIRITV